MTVYRYQALGPLLAGEGSRAFLGLAISEDDRAVPVVIIWVPEHAEKDPEMLAKVRRETEHAAKLDHPNIVTVLGFASLDEGHARVVEFADGESLRKVLEASVRLPPAIAARIICDACTGVHYAHVAGNDDGSPLVHGDLRPETLLVGYHGSTKVTGYGALAFAPREAHGPSVHGRQVYSAPEQIISGRASFGLTTDVYLLGLALYEALTGVVPWSDQGEFFEHAVLTLPLPPAVPDTIPPALDAVLQKACAKKAVDRYANPLLLREAIEMALDGEVASTEEVARHLEAVLPQAHELRADRRRTIDAGIADFVRRQWAERAAKPVVAALEAPVDAPPPVPAVPVPPPPPPPPSLPRGRPATPAVAMRPIRPPTDEDDEPERGTGRSMPWLITLALFVGVIAAWWGWKKANEPIPGVDAPLKLAAREDVSRRPPPDVDASGAVTPVTGAAAALEAPRAAAAVDSGASTPVDASAEPSPSEVLVTVQSVPSVELSLEGEVLGRTPWSGRLPPGRKTFTLQNKDLGINAGRVVTVKSEPVSERFVFEKGTVSINAPEGALVVIDGQRIGVAPIEGEVPIYEGSHRIVVTVGKSRWTDSFRLRARQKVHFNVSLR